jgi:signal peptidase II
MTKQNRPYRLIFTILVSIVVSDQLTKILATAWLKDQPPRVYLDGIARLEFVRNPGAFLSLGASLDDGARFWILTAGVSVFLVIAGWILFFRTNNLLYAVSLALIVAGGIGNLIDRVLYGSVIDFMNLGFGNLRTGVFNIADMAISLGAVLMLVDTVRSMMSESRARSKAGS